MNLQAHSPVPGRGIPAQSYRDHVLNVELRAYANARDCALYMGGDYSLQDKEAFIQTITSACRYHDLGKPDVLNQEVLSGKKQAIKLPVLHTDAGSAYLLQKKLPWPAILAYSHHRGLPSMPEEKNRGDKAFRDDGTIQRTEEKLTEYLTAHDSVIPLPTGDKQITLRGLPLRLALSCLVDGDHGDTADHYGNDVIVRPPYPRWEERLEKLDAEVQALFDANPDERNKRRMELYLGNRNANTRLGIKCCTNTVGAGKTTSVMAHLLRVAAVNGLRRIFVVLPYTNIISQAVDVYRRMLTLDGEDPNHVVAELHHRVDFDSREARKLASLWEAPIVVTTAVSFFETLAAKRTGRLRKLHSLPGSAIFVDEAHTAIPARLWPVSWKWVKELSLNWSCHWVMASGSLSKFWDIPDFGTKERVADITPIASRKEADVKESERIQYVVSKTPKTIPSVFDFVTSEPGPRLVVVNTVQTAAVLAQYMRRTGHETLHMSTALTPADREVIIVEIKKRLTKGYNGGDWTLVATTCVEAGIDISFRTGFRERGSFCSMVQLGGRVNRNAQNNPGIVHDFVISDPTCARHPDFERPARVLSKMWGTGMIDRLNKGELSIANLATESLRREMYGDFARRQECQAISKIEKEGDYPEVSERYRVISSDTRLVVVDPLLVQNIEAGIRVDRRELARNSVQLWGNKIAKLGLPEIKGMPEAFKWVAQYDKDFLGYMAGVLPILKLQAQGFSII